MNQNDADSALTIVYEAALRPELWPDALSQLAETCGAHIGAAQMIGPAGYVGLFSRGTEDVMAEYLKEDWHLRNSRMTRGLALTRAGFKGLITEERMLTAEERARDPYQQEFARHHGVDCSAGMVIASHGGTSFVLNIERSAKAGHYLDSELRSMNRLMTGIAEACSFALRLKLTVATQMIEALGAKGEALALLTETGSILHHTARFEVHLGNMLTTRNGRLHALSLGNDRQLQALIGRAAAGPSFEGSSASIVLKRPEGGPLFVRALPVTGSNRDFLGLARIVLAIDDPSCQRPTSATYILGSLFGLTPSESRLAARLGAGATLREAAEAEAIGFETARTRLKIIFGKTNTNRQAELAVLVDRLAR